MGKVIENFHALIRRVLQEEIKKRDAIEERVPEQDGNGLDVHKDKNKTFKNLENPRDIKSQDELLADLTKVVADINKAYPVVWDDHDDLKIDAKDLMKITITPDWEDHYEIVILTRNEDRVWITGLDWNQVKDCVKTNLTAASNNKKPTNVDRAYDKSYRNSKDQIPAPAKELSQKDKPKILPLTNEPPKETKNKEKDYTEKQNKEEDNPNQPMKEVESFKRQIEYKVQDPVRLRKRIPNTKLVIKKS